MFWREVVLRDRSIDDCYCEPFASLKDKLREAISVVRWREIATAAFCGLAMTVPQTIRHRAVGTGFEFLKVFEEVL